MIKGLDSVISELNKYEGAIQEAAQEAAFSVAQDVRTIAIKSIQGGTKSGYVYVRGPGQNLSATHQASAPGEAPATDSGNLVSHIVVEEDGKDYRVWSKAPYSEQLEYVLGRQFMHPAAEQGKKGVKKHLTSAIKRRL